MLTREQRYKQDLNNWEKLINSIFNNNVPKRKEWTDLNNIIDILSAIGTNKAMNHAFMPGGGGDDLSNANSSYENYCIELRFGSSIEIVKPSKLTFHSFENYPDWSYFRLDCTGLLPTGVYNSVGTEFEELTEISPLQYVNRSVWDEGYYGSDENGNPEPLPHGSRTVMRLVKDGALVIFSKSSIYNRIPENYDGIHNKMSNHEFENHIQDAINVVNK